VLGSWPSDTSYILGSWQISQLALSARLRKVQCWQAQAPMPADADICVPDAEGVAVEASISCRTVCHSTLL